ncbi:MAG: hypothetical protein JW909_06255 [Planctomycetes bacterium]|nr:hypothetical protein [Planctomycetota bacterium]
MTRRRYIAAILMLAAAARTLSAAADEAPFVLSVDVPGRPELSCRYLRDVAVFLPAATRATLSPATTNAVTLPDAWYSAGGMVINRTPENCVVFTPAVAGRYDIRLAPPDSGSAADDIAVKAYVVVPANQTGTHRVRVGRTTFAYPDPERSASKRVRENAVHYLPPLLFLALATWEDSAIAPGLTGAAFLPADRKGRRAASVFPASPAIANKLAVASAVMKQKKLDPAAIVFVSGFRPPAYNRKAGGAAYSRHMYGDAVDLIYDADGDGRMDDLTSDGTVDRRDGVVIADIFRSAEQAGAVPGGIGVYEYPDPKSRLSHVHIDARGYVTRWGTSYGTGRAAAFKWWPEGEFEDEKEDE